MEIINNTHFYFNQLMDKLIQYQMEVIQYIQINQHYRLKLVYLMLLFM